MVRNLTARWFCASSVAVMAAVMASPSQPVAAQDSTCGWSDQISVHARNVLFIDEAASYWSAAVSVPDGGHVEVAGDFPRARYLSLIVYDPRGTSVDHIADHEIDPVPGSANPFRTGSDRDAADRGYTMRVVDGREPAEGGAPNTLYTESADGTRSSNGMASVTLRIYLPDDVTDPTGGVGLPTITSVSADGARTIHEACLDNIDLDSGLGSAIQVPGGQGDDPPRWSRFLPDGFGDNPDNSYLTETFMPSLGPVLTLRAKAPTTGLTANGGTQLRYWSFCSNLLTTAVHACVVDHDVPVDNDGYMTIVVSRVEDRPVNATTDCGVAWLEAAPDDDTILAYRHMLPDPSFSEAIQHLDPGSEEQQMGDYYPAGTYSTVDDYERFGCAEPADASNDPPADGDQAAAKQDTDGGISNSAIVAGIAVAAVLIGALTLGVSRRRARRHRTA